MCDRAFTSDLFPGPEYLKIAYGWGRGQGWRRGCTVNFPAEATMIQRRFDDSKLSLFSNTHHGQRPDTDLPLFSSGAGRRDAQSGEHAEAQAHVDPKAHQCAFLKQCKRFLSKKLAPADARNMHGFLVYVVLAQYPINYPKGPSAVKYIGFTTNIDQRFKSHKKICPGDQVQLLSLNHLLHKIEAHDRTEWNSQNRRERDKFAKQTEAALQQVFTELLGQLPRDNHQQEPLTLTGLLLTHTFFRA
jgi:hypothetical protein